MAQAKRKPTPVAAETVPGSFIIDPAQVPERYALIVQGDCMAPLHRDGDVVTADKRAPYEAGDLVVIYIKPELVKPGRCNAMLKRLVSIPHWATTFPFKDHPESEVIAIATVETLNPPRRLHYRCADVLAIHRCTGAAPGEIMWAGPHASRVHASDVTKANPSRRTILAGIAASPALAAPALALSGPDPIFAAIEHYRAAVETRRAALLRSPSFTDESPFAHLPEDAPECILADQESDAACDREFAALDELIATQPTTAVGVAALLEMLGADPYWEIEGSNPDVSQEPLIVMALERSPDLMRTLAAAMRAIGAVS
jgi:hypothetical protein